MEFMKEQNLVDCQTSMPREQLRREVEGGALVQDLERVAKSINQAAGGLLIDVQAYLWPEPLIRSFATQKRGEEYIMQLEMWSDQLVLTFLSHRVRGSVVSRYFPWVFARWLGLHDLEVVVKSTTPFDRGRVTMRDVESWFVYLLSGYDGSFAPIIPGGTSRALGAGSRVTEMSLREHMVINKVS